MKTLILNSGKKDIMISIILLCLSFTANAQNSNGFFNTLFENLTKDNQASFYIIGGVLAFGILVVIISKIIAKYQKDDGKNEKNNIRPISHRHHHHRIIKKSA